MSVVDQSKKVYDGFVEQNGGLRSPATEGEQALIPPEQSHAEPPEKNGSGRAVTAEDPTPKTSRLERRAMAARDVLRTLIRDCYLDKYGHMGNRQKSFVMNLSFRVHPADNWALDFEPAVAVQVDVQLEDQEAVSAAFSEGTVYCYRCSSSDCKHARPSSPIEVFKQYDPQGTPVWSDFLQILLDHKDERVDTLYTKPPRVLSHLQYGKALKENQLSCFGKSSKTYSVLGQVVAGYFKWPGKENEKLALTFQAVEARRSNNEFWLRLNILSRLPEDSSLELFLQRDENAWIQRAVQQCRKALQVIEKNARAAREIQNEDAYRQNMRRIPRALSQLAQSLERGYRQSARRSRHAESRRRDQRPIHMAQDDARNARPDHTYFDEKKKTFIICGEKGRAHVFNERGGHVTSFVIEKKSVDFRIRTDRWRPLTDDEFKSLLQKQREHHDQ